MACCLAQLRVERMRQRSSTRAATPTSTTLASGWVGTAASQMGASCGYSSTAATTGAGCSCFSSTALPKLATSR